MANKEVDVSQEQILKSIYTSSEIKTSEEVSGILKDILEYSEDQVFRCLGELGIKLRRFASSIDLCHPELLRIFNGALGSTSDTGFSRITCDLLKIMTYSLKQKASLPLVEYLKNFLKSDLNYDTYMLKIDGVYLNQRHLRLSKDPVLRDTIRNQVEPFVVTPQTYGLEDVKTWSDCPANFKNYHRFANKYQEDIDRANKRKQHFFDHGLTSMADAIQCDITNVESSLEQYYGFNLLSLRDAAVILAKVIGLCPTFVNEFPTDSSINFCMKSEILQDMKSLKISDMCSVIGSVYRVYSFHSLSKIAPKQIVDLIQFLDAFPELNGKPLFDHYRVLIPSINYSCCNPFGLLSYEQLAKRQTELDLELLGSSRVIAVILGEVDGRHYFISYFV